MSSINYLNCKCGVRIREVLHCRCEQTQTQQAQYNEFGKEADLRTGPLRERLQRLGGIVRELDRLQRGWGEGQGSSSVLGRGWFLLLLFWYSTDRTSWRLPNCRPPLQEISLVIYPSVLFILAVHLSIAQVATWVSVPSNASLNLLWMVVVSVALFRGHSLINVARLYMLVPLFGDDGEGCGGWRTALSSQGTSTPRTWYSSAIYPSSFRPSLVILGHFPPRLGPWVYYSKLAGVPRSFGPPYIYIYILKEEKMSH